MGMSRAPIEHRSAHQAFAKDLRAKKAEFASSGSLARLMMDQSDWMAPGGTSTYAWRTGAWPFISVTRIAEGGCRELKANDVVGG